MTILSYPTAPTCAASVLLAAILTSPALAADPVVQWRADYNAARREAQEKGIPMLVEVGTEECYYCKKQDATTFRDPDLVALLNARFVAVRVDANRDPEFAQALRVQVYPTTVVGAPDGKVLAFLQGYTSAEQLRDHLKRAAPAVTVPDIVSTAEKAGRPRATQAKDLLAAAREEFRSNRFADCLDLCDRLTIRFTDLPEARDAEALASQISGDPERLAVACEQRNERTAGLYLTLAESWVKKSQAKEARECWEKAAKLSPKGRSGEVALAKLASLPKEAGETVPATFEKIK